MLDLILAICLCSFPIFGIVILYIGWQVLVSPFMYFIYKIDGGKWEFPKWFTWWIKSM